MDKRLKQVILSALKGVDLCSLYNECTGGNCKRCYFNEFDLISQLNEEDNALISVIEQGFKVSTSHYSKDGESGTISLNKNIGHYFVGGSPDIQQHISEHGEFLDSVDVYKTKIPEDAVAVFIKVKEQSDKNWEGKEE